MARNRYAILLPPTMTREASRSRATRRLNTQNPPTDAFRAVPSVYARLPVEPSSVRIYTHHLACTAINSLT